MLSLGRFALGTLELAAVIGAAWIGASAFRRRFIPAWHGLVARLADAVVTLSVLVVVGELLGTFGLFREWIVVVAVVAVGVSLRLVLSVPTTQIRVARTDRSLGWDGVVALIAVAITVGQWADRIGGVLDGGITSFDSVHYHLAFAARFAQTGSTAHIQLITPEFPDAYHHANAELLHALGMLVFHSDVLSVVLNLGFVALAIAAAYCIGDRWSEGPLSVIGVCVLLASPLMGLHHAGTATNDVVALAFVLCAAALLLHTDGGVPGFGVVGLAAGMALGTKLTAAAVAVAIVLAVPVLAPRGRRLLSFAVAVTGAALPSAYWFVRDFVDTGSPVPGVDLPLFSSASFHTLDDLGFSIGHYVTSTDVWRDWFFPGLRIDLGRAWPFVLAAVVVSIVLAVASRERPARVLGVVGAAGLAFYLVTPTTALGPADQPLLFASNVRYASPVLALALALVPSHRVVRRAPVRGIVAGLLLGTLVIAQFAAGPFPGWPDDHRLLGLVVGAAVVLATVAALLAPRATVAVGAVVIVAFAYPIAHQYDVRRYATDSVARWTDDVHGARIGIAGFGPQLDLAGRDFSNRVQYVAERGANGAFHEYASCGAWRRALRQGDYDYVVVAPRYPGAATHAVAWTASDPAASVVITNGTQTVYRFDRTVADPGC